MMSGTRFDVTGIGNAIVDVIAHADEGFLSRHNIQKGAMTLIDEQRAQALYEKMASGREISGGSAANTIAGIANLGGRTAFIGKLRDDRLGTVFAHDIRAAGVHYDTAPAREGPATARCLILVTPDAQRSMNTFLGASQNLAPADIAPELVQSAAITYLEGYLWDPPQAKAAFLKAAKLAHQAHRKIAFTLSDPFCVQRYRAEFQHLVAEEVDILFANEVEITALYECNVFEDALAAVRHNCALAALTRSEKGCVIATPDKLITVPAEPVAHVVDTTGAGDLFAAGFLYGFTRGAGLENCGRMGVRAASEIISHYGARPEADLKLLFRQRGLI
jgi:sugar/nucleoside kinase (ribokinase family)